MCVLLLLFFFFKQRRMHIKNNIQIGIKLNSIFYTKYEKTACICMMLILLKKKDKKRGLVVGTSRLLLLESEISYKWYSRVGAKWGSLR